MRFFLLLIAPFFVTKALATVIGNDDRVAILSDQYPWRSVGWIEGANCTGVLVSKDLVLTAAHCVVDTTTKKFKSGVGPFKANLRVNGLFFKKAEITQVWWGTNEPRKYPHDDWALLKLDTALGETMGYLGIAPTPLSPVDLVGYTPDLLSGKTPVAHRSCTISQIQNALLIHQCDSLGNGSAEPLISTCDFGPCIIGINVNAYGFEDNAAVSANRFEKALLAIKAGKQWP